MRRHFCMFFGRLKRMDLIEIAVMTVHSVCVRAILLLPVHMHRNM